MQEITVKLSIVYNRIGRKESLLLEKFIDRGEKMAFLIDDWINQLVMKEKKEYGDRVAFIGLQGSYRRKEAIDAKKQVIAFPGAVNFCNPTELVVLNRSTAVELTIT